MAASRSSATPLFVGLTTLILAAAVFVALLPVASGGVVLNPGDIAFRTVRAPRDISFQSSSLTSQRQDEAAKAVPDVLVYDPSVAAKQQAALNTVLDRITAIRNDTGQQAQA